MRLGCSGPYYTLWQGVPRCRSFSCIFLSLTNTAARLPSRFPFGASRWRGGCCGLHWLTRASGSSLCTLGAGQAEHWFGNRLIYYLLWYDLGYESFYCLRFEINVVCLAVEPLFYLSILIEKLASSFQLCGFVHVLLKALLLTFIMKKDRSVALTNK